MINKLIIPAAGQKIILLFSTIKQLHNKNVWNINNINEISGTSAGAIIAVLLALKIDLQIIEDYFIERPWNKFFPKFNNLINNIFNSGIFDKSYCYKFFEPLFKLSDINLNITLKEFFNINNIKLNIYVTNLNQYVYQLLSYDTFPNLSLIDAVYMSSTLPLLCQPIIYNNITYIDGGFFKYYPIDNNENINKENTLIFIFKNIENCLESNNINTIQLITNIIMKTIDFLNYNVNHSVNTLSFKNSVLLLNDKSCYDIYDWLNFFNDFDIRKKNVELGKLYANNFLKQLDINNQIINFNK